MSQMPLEFKFLKSMLNLLILFPTPKLLKLLKEKKEKATGRNRQSRLRLYSLEEKHFFW